MATPTPSPTPKPKGYDGFAQAQAAAQQAGNAAASSVGGGGQTTIALPATSGPTPVPGTPLNGIPVNPPNFNPTANIPTDPAAAAAFQVNLAQTGAGQNMGVTNATVGQPVETTNAPAGGGGSRGAAPRLPLNGPYVLGPDGQVHYIAPPQGFLSDFAGDPNAEGGWMWNPTFQQYQRVQWNPKTGKWEGGTRFMEGPPVNAAGQLTPGLPTVGGLNGQGGTAVFPIAPKNVPFLPSYLAPAQGQARGQQIPISTLGMPMISSDMVGAGGVASQAGTVGGQLVSNTRPSQIEVRSPAGGYGIGVDTASTLAAYGLKPTGSADTDQALTTGILARRAELEQAGVPTGTAIEIVRAEVKSKSGQSDAISNVSNAPGFAYGGQMTVNRPTAMIDMQTGQHVGTFGEGGQETATFTPRSDAYGTPSYPGTPTTPVNYVTDPNSRFFGYPAGQAAIWQNEADKQAYSIMSTGGAPFDPRDPTFRMRSALQEAMREGNWGLVATLQGLLGAQPAAPATGTLRPQPFPYDPNDLRFRSTASLPLPNVAGITYAPVTG